MEIFFYSLLGSIITLLAKWVIDLTTDSIKEKRERRKMLFQRKAEAAERAMSFYVELYANWYMLKDAMSRFTINPSPAVIETLNTAIANNQRIQAQQGDRLNAINLYYDFSDIEKEHNIPEVNKILNSLNDIISKTYRDIFNAKQNGLNDNQLIPIYQLLTKEYNIYAEAIDVLLLSIAEVQDRLRKDYEI